MPPESMPEPRRIPGESDLTAQRIAPTTLARPIRESCDRSHRKAPTPHDPSVVMVVDDTPASVSFLFEVLDQAGYQVMLATGGADALNQLNERTPDLILLDAVMPGMDGFDVCRRLHEAKRTREIPVIFMTGLGDSQDVVRGFSEGAVDYVVKPVNPDELLIRIQSHLMQARRIQRVQDVLAADHEATIAVDNEGQVVWMMGQARHRLKHYHGEWKDNEEVPSLPAPLLAWVIDRLADETGEASPYAIAREGQTLRVRLQANTHIGGAVLYLSEQRDPPCAEGLARRWGLTERESEVLLWVARGKTNPEIGLILGISPRTVNKHLDHIFSKLGVETRTAAALTVLNPHTE
ncbi:MAG: response regulator transcription factor [Pseudomonadota bacterium]|nr:response regulator transcription factor [Pseudomonadota bacterium]